MRFFLPAAMLLLFFSVASYGDDFPAIYNSDTEAEAEPMEAVAAAQSMQTPAGFEVSVFASEPDVQNPIDMAWDTRGRLWIAENYTYAERSQRFDLSLRDRVVILEDTDHDGSADVRRVFTDQVQMLTSLEVGGGGVWLMCPPQLLFIPDRNGDDQPDGPAEVMLDGFEVAKENYHNFANGLRWGPDGWLYGRCGGSCPGRVGKPGTPAEQRVALEGGIWRYHPETAQVEVLTHGTTNPWGHDWNAFGEGFFINTVNGHLWHLIPGAHLMRPFTLDPNPHVYELIDMHADHWHFDTSGSWTDSRDGAANAFGGGHAHCGMMVYQGDNWPAEYRGHLFTWNIHGQRANQEILVRHGSGYVGKHSDDLLISGDPFFRGMELSSGPDGAVYAIDWSDTGECHEHTGVHRTSGRVYKITFDDGRTPGSFLTQLPTAESRQLAKLMSHENIWHVRAARRILAERGGAETKPSTDWNDAVDVLQQLVGGDDPRTAVQAIFTLHAMDEIGPDSLHSLLDHDNEHVRSIAIRLLTDHWPIDDCLGPIYTQPALAQRVANETQQLLPRFCELAESDSSGLVRLTLASTLQRLPVDDRPTLARSLVSRQEDAEDHNLPLLVWYGLIPAADSDAEACAGVAIASTWPKTQRLIARRLAERLDEEPAATQRLLEHVIETDQSPVRMNVLSGLADGLKGWSRAPEPENWKRLVSVVKTEENPELAAIVRDLSVLFGDGRALEEVRRIVLDDEADISLRRSALETLVTSKDQGVREICLALLGDARLNYIALKGLTSSNEPEVADAILENYRRFRAPQRPKAIEVLVSRPPFAARLLEAIANNRIPTSDLTAYDVRQIRSLGDPALQERVRELWGDVRETPAEKQTRIAQLKDALTTEQIADAEPSRGRLLFKQKCSTCHTLFGDGESIGPDLTGGNRSNLHYLLENVIDPSAVVSKDYRMSVLLLADGRVLNGLIVSQNEKTLTLQTQTDKLTINRDDIEQTRLTSLSPMPDGLLDNLTEQQTEDLIAYLMQPAQVPLPRAAAGSE